MPLPFARTDRAEKNATNFLLKCEMAHSCRRQSRATVSVTGWRKPISMSGLARPFALYCADGLVF
jgi:hypothetical protein